MSEQKDTNMSQHFYRASAADFMKIPGSPVAYWASKSIILGFAKNPLLEDRGLVRQGASTSDNNRFLRLWFEVSNKKIGFNINNTEGASNSLAKWFPYNKGGDYRKWYGNQDYVINYKNDGEELKKFQSTLNQGWTARLKSRDYYFKKTLSWSKISSGSFSCRYYPHGFIFDVAGCCYFPKKESEHNNILCFLNSSVAQKTLKFLSPTLNFEIEHIKKLPYINTENIHYQEIINAHIKDWNSYEIAWDFTTLPLLAHDINQATVSQNYKKLCEKWLADTQEMQRLEEENNRIFIEAYGLQDELTPEVPLNEITLTCNPHYRYGGDLTDQEREERLQSDTIAELVSYAIGCMMGRYSLDKEGLILASQGETIQDYLAQIPNPRFMPDEDAIIPLTDEEWFPDDATNLVRDFIRTVWGEETLQENLDFIAESLCLHAIRARKSETALETIRRYLSTQFYKDHMRTYKKRPIYWLFSSGKQKAFECLVYLHRYNESTLSRMRTEYVTQLMGKYESQINHLEEQVTQASTSEKTKLNRALRDYHAKLNELREFDNKLKHYADMRIALDLDDGVKENYGKFGDLLANVRDITGKKPK